MSVNIPKACDKLKQEFNLTNAEHEILLLVSKGHTPLEISEIRERSIETVRTQIKRIMQKLNVRRTHNMVLKVFHIAEELSP